MRSLTEADLDRLDQVRARFADDPLLKTGAVKLMADGVIETHTAAMLEPYANRPGAKGEPRFTAEAFNQIVAMLDRREWQVMTHAIGDAAIRMTLDAYDARRQRAIPRRRAGAGIAIEHIESIDPLDIPRFAQARRDCLDAAAPRAAEPGRPAIVWSTNIGPERAAHGWLWGSIARAGGRLAFGSDWPVVTLDPRPGPARGGQSHHARRTARRRMAAAERLSLRKAHRRLHARRRVGVVRRAAQGHARPRHAGRPRGVLGRHLRPSRAAAHRRARSS